MTAYGCVATGHMEGMLEIVQNAETISNIQQLGGNIGGAFNEGTLKEWLRHHNKGAAYDKAVQVFIKSCAGYCVAR